MNWYISHQSALEFWRKTFAEDAFEGKRLPACKLPHKPADARGLRHENPWLLSMPLHVLVGSSNARKATKSLTCHIASKKFPIGSFIQLPSGLIVSSPELCFVQMASELSLIELIMLGFEFCGGYRLDTEAEPGRGFRDDIPLTSVARLSSFVAKIPGMKGRKKALRALRYLADGSASPMETSLTMLLSLPYKLGGYGFPKPLLNAPIEIRLGAKNGNRKLKFYCDLYWPDKQIDVEYDSDAYHTTDNQIFRDATRRNTLSSAGIKVITVSRKHIFYTAELRRIAEALSTLLKKRLQYSMSEFAMRHAALRGQVLPKKSSYVARKAASLDAIPPYEWPLSYA